MKILLNGKKHDVRSTQLFDLIEELGYAKAFIGVAVNSVVVPKAKFLKTQLFEGDRIEVIAPLQGG